MRTVIVTTLVKLVALVYPDPDEPGNDFQQGPPPTDEMHTHDKKNRGNDLTMRAGGMD